MSTLDDIKAKVEGHTPGPWVYNLGLGLVEDVPEFDLHRFDIMAISIAKVEESDADGELIAAAPKLLAALEAVDGVGPYLLSEHPTEQAVLVAKGWDSARAAILRAVTEALS